MILCACMLVVWVRAGACACVCLSVCGRVFEAAWPNAKLAGSLNTEHA